MKVEKGEKLEYNKTVANFFCIVREYNTINEFYTQIHFHRTTILKSENEMKEKFKNYLPYHFSS